MAGIELRSVSKDYGAGAPAVDDVSLDIRDGEFMILLGPSGCGKSTTLRMIAGLEDATSGEIRIGGELVNDKPPRERNVAVVFQSYALYPHMTVAQNLAFGLKMHKRPESEITARVQEVSRTLGLEPLLGRKPAALSGGQRQRVALGRALVREPDAFLLDEPLSNLDAQLRSDMRLELVKLHRRLGTTTIHVTHDQVEAMTMGERICIMQSGRVVQVGAPIEVYRNPANTFVARFLARPATNLIGARLLPAEGGGLRIEAPGLGFPLPADLSAVYRAHAGKDVIFGLRPEDIGAQPLGAHSVAVEGSVVAVETLGPETVLVFSLRGQAGEDLSARLDRNYRAEPGAPVRLHLDLTEMQLFDAATTNRIPRATP